MRVQSEREFISRPKNEIKRTKFQISSLRVGHKVRSTLVFGDISQREDRRRPKTEV